MEQKILHIVLYFYGQMDTYKNEYNNYMKKFNMAPNRMTETILQTNISWVELS